MLAHILMEETELVLAQRIDLLNQMETALSIPLFPSRQGISKAADGVFILH